MSGQAGVVAVTCLALEAGIARGPGVSVLCNQGSGLRAALRAAIDRGASGIISFGIAGGLAPELGAGDWVVASGVANGQGRDRDRSRMDTQRLLEILPAPFTRTSLARTMSSRARKKNSNCTVRPARPPSTWNRTLPPRLPPREDSVCRVPSHPRCGAQDTPTGCDARTAP